MNTFNYRPLHGDPDTETIMRHMLSRDGIDAQKVSSAALLTIDRTDMSFLAGVVGVAPPVQSYFQVFVLPQAHVDVQFEGVSDETPSSSIDYLAIVVGVLSARGTINNPTPRLSNWNSQGPTEL